MTEHRDYTIRIDDLLDELRAVAPELAQLSYIDFHWKVANRGRPVVTQVIPMALAKYRQCQACQAKNGAALGTPQCPTMTPVLNVASSRLKHTIWFDATYCEYAQRVNRGAVLLRNIEESRIHPDDVANYALDKFDTTWHPDARVAKMLRASVASCRQYVDDYENHAKHGVGLYAFGKTVGSGKSMLAIGTAIEICSRYGVPFKYINFARFLNEYKRRLSDDNMAAFELLPDLMDFEGVLVLDDFGKEVATDRVVEMAYSLINARYMEHYVTLFSANWPIDELAEQRYQGIDGDAIVDRIRERSLLVDLTGVPSYRDKRRTELLGA